MALLVDWAFLGVWCFRDFVLVLMASALSWRRARGLVSSLDFVDNQWPMFHMFSKLARWLSLILRLIVIAEVR